MKINDEFTNDLDLIEIVAREISYIEKEQCDQKTNI